MKYFELLFTTLFFLISFGKASNTFSKKRNLKYVTINDSEIEIEFNNKYENETDKCKKAILSYLTINYGFSSLINSSFSEFCDKQNHGEFKEYYEYLESVKGQNVCIDFNKKIQNFLDYSTYELENKCIRDESNEFCYKYLMDPNKYPAYYDFSKKISENGENMNILFKEKEIKEKNYLMEKCNNDQLNLCEQSILTMSTKGHDLLNENLSIKFVTNDVELKRVCPVPYNIYVYDNTTIEELKTCKTYEKAVTNFGKPNPVASVTSGFKAMNINLYVIFALFALISLL